MEIRIGVQNVAREIVFESEQPADSVSREVQQAMNNNSALTLTDNKGHLVIVPAHALGYVNIAAEQKGRVGFGG